MSDNNSESESTQQPSSAVPPQSSQGQPPDFDVLLPAFQQFCEVIAKLRSPDGCPWDRQQTLATIKPYTLEETYELLEAIDADDNVAIQEELGDVLLQVILDAQIAADENRFQLADPSMTVNIHGHEINLPGKLAAINPINADPFKTRPL